MQFRSLGDENGFIRDEILELLLVSLSRVCCLEMFTKVTPYHDYVHPHGLSALSEQPTGFSVQYHLTTLFVHKSSLSVYIT